MLWASRVHLEYQWAIQQCPLKKLYKLWSCTFNQFSFFNPRRNRDYRLLQRMLSGRWHGMLNLLPSLIVFNPFLNQLEGNLIAITRLSKIFILQGICEIFWQMTFNPWLLTKCDVWVSHVRLEKLNWIFEHMQNQIMTKNTTLNLTISLHFASLCLRN